MEWIGISDEIEKFEWGLRVKEETLVPVNTLSLSLSLSDDRQKPSRIEILIKMIH